VKLAVVGGGVIGLAASWQAARRGHAVELFETGAIPNPDGASHDQHRLCRVPYGSQDGYARLMAPAMAAWDRAFAAMGARHYVETGCLALCTAEGDWTDRSRVSLARLGLPHRLLGAAEIAARCPMLRVHDARYGLWSEPGGVLFADRITTGFAALAEAEGVRLHPHSRAAMAGDALSVDGVVIGCDAVLVAAGAWTAALVPWIGAGLTPLRQVVTYAAPPASLRAAWQAAPILLGMGGAAGPRGLFAAPPVAGRGLKFGCGALNHPGDPDCPRTAAPGEPERVLGAWADRLVDFAGYQVTEAKVCVYAKAEDENFAVGRQGRVLAITGCSGHAFKLAALLGEGLADALDGHDAPLAWMRGDADACTRLVA
jgi:glycine/D-amino acid oxidase-like deaminating enzyme